MDCIHILCKYCDAKYGTNEELNHMWAGSFLVQEKKRLCKAMWAKTKKRSNYWWSFGHRQNLVDVSILSKDFEKFISDIASYSPACRNFKQGNKWRVVGLTGCLAETEESLSTSGESNYSTVELETTSSSDSTTLDAGVNCEVTGDTADTSDGVELNEQPSSPPDQRLINPSNNEQQLSVMTYHQYNKWTENTWSNTCSVQHTPLSALSNPWYSILFSVDDLQFTWTTLFNRATHLLYHKWTYSESMYTCHSCSLCSIQPFHSQEG